MRNVLVTTLMWGSAWDRYGVAFAETFCKFWPAEYGFFLITDKERPVFRGRQLPLHKVPGYRIFKSENEHNPIAHGMDRPGAKVDKQGKSWRHDAMKWFPQGLSPRAAMNTLQDGDILVWLDADVHTVAPVPADWIENLLGDHDIACLQRAGTHSEIGFIAFSVNPRTRKVVDMMAEAYVSGSIYKMREQHSAFVFDRCVEAVPDVKVKNLNETGRKGHVWPHTELAKYTVHKKGKRKDA